MAKITQSDFNKAKANNTASIQRSKAYAEKIERMFAETVNEILAIRRTMPDVASGEMFSFDAQPQATRKQVEFLLRRLSATATLATENGIKLEWDKANEATDALIRTQLGSKVLKDPHFSAWQKTNHGAMYDFMNRKEGVMTLKDRIWQTTRQLREEMEVAMTVSVGEGKSAREMARDVKKYLNDPDLMFRRFRYKIKDDENGNPVYGRKWKKKERDENGKVHWIDYDKDAYKVGRGMYKSASKNAMRVTRTETNMAYRRADQKRWQQLDFILGYHVEPCANHEPEDCEPDICEFLQGDYPKDFIFEGWHPCCKCVCTPIMMDEDDMLEMFNAKLQGKEYTSKQKQITNYPEGFKKWCSLNAVALEDAHKKGKDPYFIRHNYEVAKQAMAGENKIVTPVINKRTGSDGKSDKNNTVSVARSIANVKIESLCKEIGKIKGIEYKQVQYYENQPTEEQIIDFITQREKSEESCGSIALAYCANKAGIKMTDFAGGKSAEFFRAFSNLQILCESQGGEFDYGSPVSIIKRMKVGKQYFAVFGGHASIVKNNGNGNIEFLELQAGLKYRKKNGWKKLDEGIFKSRFGVIDNMTTSIYIEIDKITQDKNFPHLMGYINTQDYTNE